MPVNFVNIPDALKQSASFCVWKMEKRSGRPTKVPYNPRTGNTAKTNDPSTFADFKTAMKTYAIGGWNGIGYRVSEGIGAIDIDHIVPLSKGGKHMKSNCQLAHRLCNSLKLDTTEDFKVDWRQKLINEPGRWNARLDALWDQLGATDRKKVPTRITIQPTTTIRAGLGAGAAPTGPRSNL